MCTPYHYISLPPNGVTAGWGRGFGLRARRPLLRRIRRPRFLRLLRGRRPLFRSRRRPRFLRRRRRPRNDLM